MCILLLPCSARSTPLPLFPQVYGIKAAKVNSLNVEGKKKWKPGRLGVIRRKSYKKFYVRLARGSVLPETMLAANDGDDMAPPTASDQSPKVSVLPKRPQ